MPLTSTSVVSTFAPLKFEGATVRSASSERGLALFITIDESLLERLVLKDSGLKESRKI